MPSSITELVDTYQRRTGDSLPAIARRGERLTGHRVSEKYLWEVSRGNVKGFPKSADAICSLAAGLETTEREVVLGYAVSLGVPVRAPGVAGRLPLGLDHAPPRLLDALVTMSRAIAHPDAVEEDRTPADATPTVREDQGAIPLLAPDDDATEETSQGADG